MAGIKAELEDLAFKFLEPEDYQALAEQVAAKRAEREQMIEQLRAPLEDELRRAGHRRVRGHRPAEAPLVDLPEDEAAQQAVRRDLRPHGGARDRRNRARSATTSLGIIHHNWTPLQERIKDYIASPKSNGYQSLHTTIFGPGGQLFEVQIRTREMHRTAEYGIAAHWLYKDGRASADELDRHLGWFRQLLELQQDTHSAGGVPRVPQGRPVPGRDLRLHAARAT